MPAGCQWIAGIRYSIGALAPDFRIQKINVAEKLGFSGNRAFLLASPSPPHLFETHPLPNLEKD
jgi:hypothetical protein